MTIYLNASGRGLPSKRTERRIRDHPDLELRIGAIAASKSVEPELSQIRDQAASLIGGAPGQIGFSSTTSSAWLSIVARLNIAGKRLLVAPHEWGANVTTLKTLACNAGARIEVLPQLDLKNPDVGEWQSRIDEDVAANRPDGNSRVGPILRRPRRHLPQMAQGTEANSIVLDIPLRVG